jgi:hypothetical protein
VTCYALRCTAASSSALLEAAGRGRALGLLAGLVSSVSFQQERDAIFQHVAARIVYRLLTEMLEFDQANRRCVVVCGGIFDASVLLARCTLHFVLSEGSWLSAVIALMASMLWHDCVCVCVCMTTCVCVCV